MADSDTEYVNKARVHMLVEREAKLKGVNWAAAQAIRTDGGLLPEKRRLTKVDKMLKSNLEKIERYASCYKLGSVELAVCRDIYMAHRSVRRTVKKSLEIIDGMLFNDLIKIVDGTCTLCGAEGVADTSNDDGVCFFCRLDPEGPLPVKLVGPRPGLRKVAVSHE